MFKEFKEFAIRGNVADMAVGIIIGGAFATIARSLVDDVLMPPLGLLLGGVDFQDFFVVLREGALAAGPYETLALAREAGAVTLNWGVFANNVLTFLLIAWAVFLLVKGMNRLRRAQDEGEETVTPSTRPCPFCHTDIPIPATRCPYCTSEVEPA